MTASTAARGDRAGHPVKSPLAASHDLRAEPEYTDRAITVAPQPGLTPREATARTWAGEADGFTAPFFLVARMAAELPGSRWMAAGMRYVSRTCN